MTVDDAVQGAGLDSEVCAPVDGAAGTPVDGAVSAGVDSAVSADMTLDDDPSRPADLAGAPHPEEASASETIATCVGMAEAWMARATEEDGALLTSTDLSRVTEISDSIAARLDVLRVRVIAEAISRGEPAAQGYSPTDWVQLQWPSASRSQVLDLLALATSVAAGSTPEAQADEPAHQQVWTAFTTGEVNLRRCSMVLRALRRIRPGVNDVTYAEDAGALIGAARREIFTENDLTRITDRLIASALSDRDHTARDAFARGHRAVNESSLAGGSITRFIIHAEPEGAAVIRSILISPLAAPGAGLNVSSDSGGTGTGTARAGSARGTGAGSDVGPGSPSGPVTDPQRDPRTPAQRRYDALMTILGRGVAAPEGQPTTAKTQVMVTLAYDLLSAAVLSTGSLSTAPLSTAMGNRDRGHFTAGCTQTGEILSPATARRLACEADIIPAVLGSRSELLDLGRTRRLVTPGQRRALTHRDRHCTYPGCSMPATWSDAHHIVHWADGGASDLSNLTLLCRRHHTHVHEHALSASVDPRADPGTCVTWHLRPAGRAP